MSKALALIEMALFGLLALLTLPVWLPILIVALSRSDQPDFTRQSECEYLRRLRG